MSPTLRRTLLLLLLAAAGVYAVVHLTGPNGIKAFLVKRRSIRQMEKEVQILENRVSVQAQYAADIEAGKPEVIIPLIRSRTGWIRDGEKDFWTPKVEPRRAAPAPEIETPSRGGAK